MVNINLMQPTFVSTGYKPFAPIYYKFFVNCNLQQNATFSDKGQEY